MELLLVFIIPFCFTLLFLFLISKFVSRTPSYIKKEKEEVITCKKVEAMAKDGRYFPLRLAKHDMQVDYRVPLFDQTIVYEKCKDCLWYSSRREKWEGIIGLLKSLFIVKR